MKRRICNSKCRFWWGTVSPHRIAATKVVMIILCGNFAEDLLEIQEVAMLKKGEKWEDATYCVQGSIMDAVSFQLYRFLTGWHQHARDSTTMERFNSQSFHNKFYSRESFEWLCLPDNEQTAFLFCRPCMTWCWACWKREASTRNLSTRLWSSQRPTNTTNTWAFWSSWKNLLKESRHILQVKKKNFLSVKKPCPNDRSNLHGIAVRKVTAIMS